MKLRKLHIEDYKMFKDFDISFVDEKDKALPIVVLAGVNGSGKTTLLEFIKELSIEEEYHYYTSENIEYDDTHSNVIGVVTRTPLIVEIDNNKILSDINRKYFPLPIIYFPSGTDEIKKVAKEFVKTFYFYLKEKDYRSSEITEHFQNYMKDIFDDLDIGFKYSHLDKDDNVWFSNTESKEYYYTAKKNNNINDRKLFTIDELSTGEKTLLSKVLYLFFQGYKNKVILIDEPELSLHPSWQNKILQVYKKFADTNNCQIIIATHSPHIIGSAKPEYIRVLNKVDNKIEVLEYSESYGLEFSQILTDIMGVDELRVPEVSRKLSKVKALIVQNDYDSDKFNQEWSQLENMLGKNYLDLKLLKLEIASRRKRASSN